MKCKLLFLFFLLLPLKILCGQRDLEAIRRDLARKEGTPSTKSSLEILNVSYDPTREFYDDYNAIFKKWWKQKTNQNLRIIQSHGASAKQARAVMSGLDADVVSLALAFDIDAIQHSTGIVGDEWQKRLPNQSSPYFSTIVFLVRKGNPKNIHDWGDLVREGVQIVTPNPKTSGGGRWGYLAAWAWAMEATGQQPDLAKEYMKKLFANAPVLDTGARGSTTNFFLRKKGDVLISWENEAYLMIDKMGRDRVEIVYPSLSIRAEPPVAWLEQIVDKKGTQDAAEFYLKYLYSLTAQELIARHHFRPYDSQVALQYEKKFPKIPLISIEELGGWDSIQKLHFGEGGIFDEVYLSEKE